MPFSIIKQSFKQRRISFIMIFPRIIIFNIFRNLIKINTIFCTHILEEDDKVDIVWFSDRFCKVCGKPFNNLCIRTITVRDL
ncbi:hypothetical protein LguiB_004254 [Lonicera macranthoides]